MKFFTTFNPAKFLIQFFLILIIIGTILLSLPISTTKGISFVDALYTATSAVCVTGLIVKNTEEDFTLFGKIVILILIQLGGLGYMAITTILILLFRQKASFRDMFLVKEHAGITSFKNFRHFLLDVARVVFIFEGIGFLLLFLYFYLFQKIPLKPSIFHALFHSVSAFCNAGFSSFGTNLSIFAYHIFVPLIIAFLFISGGLGFIVWSDIYWTYLKKRNSHINLHTKVVIFTTFFLILFGTFIIYLLEFNNTLKDFPLLNKVIISFFHAVTPRTAGFNLISVGSFQYATMIIVMFLMFIGASPGGTGGGIKTTTFLIALLYPFYFLKGTLPERIFKRKLTISAIEKSIAIVILSLILILISSFFITLIEKNINFIEILFEILSAFGTVGLSCGSKTNHLVSLSYDFSNLSKIIIILVMFFGRLGVINILRLFIKEKREHIDFPEEEISVG
ncbi:MAG: TrkH family potassium uptake protein [candidate division WOR-3 bacterium]|nr:TrkH family potassium uptake protein [candidate division WOR-3 bacterium]